MIKTRFCPSPTGRMHLGNTRTALFCALYAHMRQGVFLLRIEDTDQERSKQIYADDLMVDLEWLDLHWQEGPKVGGPAAPYYQSQRQSIYDNYYAKLEQAGRSYPCFCSEAQLALSRKVQLASGQPPRYTGTCRHLTADEVAAKKASGIVPTIRFQIPEGEVVQFYDHVHGEQAFKTDDLGDFIVRRADGTSPFMFSNAIDDALMGVTHVIRGEDHLNNTPRQIMILKALGLPVPEYGHISLILGQDGSPLSKRNGSRSVEELREQGYLPMAVINYLARLGHYYSNTEFMNFEELAEAFDFKYLSKSPARFDLDQLLHWQREAVQHLSNEEFSAWLMDKLPDVVPKDERAIFLDVIRANIIFPHEVTEWAAMLYTNDWLHPLGETLHACFQHAGRAFFEIALSAIQEHGENYEAVCEILKKEAGVKGKALFHPLRLAVTGMDRGPELVHLFSLLGRERLIARFNAILETFA